MCAPHTCCCSAPKSAAGACLFLLQAAVPQYDALFRQYVNLAASLRREVDLSLALEPQRVLGSGSVVLARGAAAPHSSIAAGSAGQLPLGGSSTRSQQQVQLTSFIRSGAAAAAAPSAPVPAAAAAAAGSNAGQAGRGGRAPHVSVLGSGAVIKAEDGSDVPQQVSNGHLDSTCDCRMDGGMLELSCFCCRVLHESR